MVKERRAQSAPHHPTAGLQGCWRHGHGYELVGVGAMVWLSGHSYRCTADIARGAIRYWRIPVVARNWDIGVRALGCLCIMRLNRLTTECRRSRPEVATAAGCGTSPIPHGMWHHHGGAFNHAGVPSSMIGATRTRPTAACRPCSQSRCRHHCCRFCCCCRRRARAGRLACGSRTSRGSARVQTLAHWRVRPRRPRRRALAAVAGRGTAQGSPLQLTTFARAHWTRRSWSGSAMALPGPAKVPPREVGWRF